MIQSIKKLIEAFKENGMALSRNDAKSMCRQECRHVLGDELFCNERYEHVEICWETGEILEFFAGINDSVMKEGEFPVYMDEDDSPFYAFILCDRKTGWLEYGPSCRRIKNENGEYEAVRETRQPGGIGKKYRNVITYFHQHRRHGRTQCS